jgi:hypothetical protein
MAGTAPTVAEHDPASDLAVGMRVPPAVPEHQPSGGLRGVVVGGNVGTDPARGPGIEPTPVPLDADRLARRCSRLPRRVRTVQRARIRSIDQQRSKRDLHGRGSRS